MGQTSDQLKAEIAGTRADMTATVNAMSDRANPRAAARRQAGRVGSRMSAMRDTIMGSVDDVSNRAHDAAGSAGSAPDAIQRKAQGNPLAAGLIAFGAGLLIASALPPSEAERRAAESLGDSAQPVVDQVQQAASEMAGQLKSSAQEAAGQVKETAADAAGQVKNQATDASQEVAGTTKAAAADVRGSAREQMG